MLSSLRVTVDLSCAQFGRLLMNRIGVRRGLGTERPRVLAASLSAAILFALATREKVDLGAVLLSAAVELRFRFFDPASRRATVFRNSAMALS